ncbi:hypothetical protein HYX70_04000 [Candidatus Saccharibacteria bacterium]|nr:hypothetical protein [Candidatus Saccharibacteria bacterium]
MITLEEANKKAEALQKDGRALLDQYDTLSLLARLGDIHVDGSFAYGLMVKPDIDFHIYSSFPDIRKVSEVSQKLLETPELVRILVSNKQDYLEPETGHPKGIYLGFRIFYKGQAWNFDVWVVKPENKVDSEMFEFGWHKKLTKEQRDSILLLKYNLKDQGRYPGLDEGMYASADIYRAVMKDGVRTIEELDEWRKTHPYC